MTDNVTDEVSKLHIGWAPGLVGYYINWWTSQASAFCIHPYGS